MQLPLVAAALVAGVGLAGLAVWAAIRSTRPTPSKLVSMEIIDDPPSLAPHPAPIAARPARAVAPVPAPARAAPPPPSSPRSHAERAPAMVLTAGVSMQDAEFERRVSARPPASPQAPGRPTDTIERPRGPPPQRSWAEQARANAGPEITTEWARRQVGPVAPGRVSGVCGGCGSRLSASDARPLRIACPVCGRTKLVA